MKPEYHPVVLDPSHDLSRFTCGHQALDRWLCGDARRAHDQGINRTFVWADGPQVLAFYSIAPTEVVRDSLPRSASGGYNRIPGYLIGRLALHERLRGKGFGTDLLVDALKTCVGASAKAGGRLIVVDPIDDSARDFYLAHDFRPTTVGTRLYMKVATAAACFE